MMSAPIHARKSSEAGSASGKSEAAKGDEVEHARRDCHLGIKAFQNVRWSWKAFEALRERKPPSSADPVAAGLFHMGVIRYAKPFLEMQSGQGALRYRERHLKRADGFSASMHAHLLKLRDKLIAHDDFTQIEPRMLTVMSGPQAGSSRPRMVVIANLILERPKTGIGDILVHVRAVSYA